ncbi:septal ring factor EnvC (AmiA/AmiB activator) [Constrictibacter sp. MBR-5]|jgi:septal ring factor EnvC (AmiA/AmiB activator)|uniref:murein hydrolase activator EnvC family protein n=1 Tax=Constrictibacter sp. MBR-5 TaxID=3156467 RepID=UPI00339B6AD1
MLPTVPVAHRYSSARSARLCGAMVAVVAATVALPLADADAQVRDEDRAKSEIRSIDRAIDLARERRERLDAEAARHAQEVEALRAQSVEVARRVQDQEAAASATELRLRDLRRETAAAEQSLNDGRDRMAVTLAALQRLARRPPEAMIAMPTSPVDTVRTAMLLGAVVPPLERQAVELRDRLATLAALREEGRRERTALANQLAALRSERAELARLAERTAVLRDRAAAERQDVVARLDSMGKEADDLRDLIKRLEAERRAEEERRRVEAERQRAEAARRRAAEQRRLAEEQRRAEEEARRRNAPPPVAMTPPPRPAELRESQPPPPVVPRGSSRTAPPARGRIVMGYGDAPPPRDRGVVLETRGDAQVVAPREGTVAYAGDFRGYGRLLIIDHGDGYHSVLMGFARIDARPGQRVIAGEPVGVMGASERGNPHLYVELRRNGQPTNPLPMLAAQRE